MAIPDEVFRRVVANARLRLEPAEAERLKRDLDAVLDAFAALERAPAAEREAYHPVEVPPALREDEPRPWPDPDALLAGRPLHDRFLKGPRVA